MSVQHPKELLRPDGSLPQLYLPSPPDAVTAANVEAYTLQILKLLGLGRYGFRWHHAEKSLGHCLKDSHIAIDPAFTQNPQYEALYVWHVVLHEIAHALEMELYGQQDNAHGRSWVHCCEALGLYDEFPNGAMAPIVPCPSAEHLLMTMLNTCYENAH